MFAFIYATGRSQKDQDLKKTSESINLGSMGLTETEPPSRRLEWDNETDLRSLHICDLVLLGLLVGLLTGSRGSL